MNKIEPIVSSQRVITQRKKNLDKLLNVRVMLSLKMLLQTFTLALLNIRSGVSASCKKAHKYA